MTTDPRTGITLLSTQQRYKEQLINEGFAHLGAIATGAVVNLSLTSPPPNPSLGEVYFVPIEAATGVWAGQENKLALRIEGGWTYFNIPLNHRIYAIQPEGLYRWDGTDWIAIVSEGDMLKSVYDTDNDGVVDAAEVANSVEWENVQDPPTILDNTDVDARITAQKGVANGLATLGSDSKIPVSQLSAIAITDTFVVNTQAAMLALTAEVGDIAIRTDLNKTFILRAEPASTLTNWQELLMSSGATAVIYSNFESITGSKTLANTDHEKTLLVSGTVTITLPAVAQNIRVNVRLVSGSVTFTTSGTTRSPSSGNLSTVSSNAFLEFNSSTNTWYIAGALS